MPSKKQSKKKAKLEFSNIAWPPLKDCGLWDNPSLIWRKDSIFDVKDADDTYRIKTRVQHQRNWGTFTVRCWHKDYPAPYEYQRWLRVREDGRLTADTKLFFCQAYIVHQDLKGMAIAPIWDILQAIDTHSYDKRSPGNASFYPIPFDDVDRCRVWPFEIPEEEPKDDPLSFFDGVDLSAF